MPIVNTLATGWLPTPARFHTGDPVTPDDVKGIGPDVLRHRIIVTYEAEAEEVTPSMVAQRILDSVEVP